MTKQPKVVTRNNYDQMQSRADERRKTRKQKDMIFANDKAIFFLLLLHIIIEGLMKRLSLPGSQSHHSSFTKTHTHACVSRSEHLDAMSSSFFFGTSRVRGQWELRRQRTGEQNTKTHDRNKKHK